MAGSAQSSEYIRGVSSAARALLLTHISEKDRKKQHESLDKYWKKCYEGVDLMEKGGVSADKIDGARKALKGWDDASRQCVDMAEKGDFKGATDFMLGGAREIRSGAEKAIEGLHEESLKSIDTLDKHASQEYEAARKAGIGAIIFAVMSAVLLALGVSRSIGKPLAKANEVFAKVGEGDLTVRMPENGPAELAAMGRVANHMLDGLKELITITIGASKKTVHATDAMDRSSRQASAASSEIATAIEQVAQGANNLAVTSQSALEATESMMRNLDEVRNATEKTAGALLEVERNQESMKTAIDLVADSAKIAADGSKVASEAAKEGKDVVDECISAMRKLQDTNEAAAERINRLGTESERIGVIVQAIDEIAEQTNLLALNAAIEAARAGEQGRGFAVVAEEVRKLAERSSSQTKEIGDLIATLQQIVGEAVAMTRQSSAEVERSAGMVDQAGQMLDKIDAAVRDAAEGMAKSAKATSEMNAASTAVAAAIDDLSASSTQVIAAMDGMSAQSQAVSSSIEQTAAIGQESAASAEEVTATAQTQTAMMEEISAESENLKSVVSEIESAVSKFKVDESTESNPELYVAEAQKAA